MRSLIEILYTNNAIFSYYGFVDNSVLEQVQEITKMKLQTNKESESIIVKVHHALEECAGNIMRHNFHDDVSRVSYKSLLMVSKNENEYNIDSIMVINSVQHEKIQTQLSYLRSLSVEELNGLKLAVNQEGKQLTLVDSDLINLVLKSDDCNFTFKALGENFLFNVCYKVVAEKV